jgi:hypothetical protein
MAYIFVNGVKKYVIGSNTDNGSDYRPYVYTHGSGSYEDDNTGYVKRVITKSYDLNLAFIRKLFGRWFLAVESLTDPCRITVQYKFDDNDGKQSISTYDLDAAIVGVNWDAAFFDTSFFTAAEITRFRISERFKQTSFGRKAVKVQFTLSSSNNSEAFIISRLGMNFAVLSERLGRNI